MLLPAVWLTATAAVLSAVPVAPAAADVEPPFDEETVAEMCTDLRSEATQRQEEAAAYLQHHATEGRWSPLALDCLLFALESGATQPIKVSASSALRPYGAAAVPGLVEIWRRNRQNNAYWVAVSALRQLGPEAAAAEAEMLARMGDSKALDAERLDAARVVWSIGNPPHSDDAYGVMLELFASADPRTRTLAAFSIAAAGKPEGITYLARCAQDLEEATKRLACVTELGNIAAGYREAYEPATAVRWLEQMRDDPDPEVRREVERGLDYARIRAELNPRSRRDDEERRR